MPNMYNEVKFGKDAQDSIYEGAKIVAKAVGSSLGPNGNCGIVEGYNGIGYTITKDGVSLAKAVAKLKDPYENIGANLMKNIASETAKVGDGTSTSTVLGFNMLEEGRKYLASGIKAYDLKKGIECATKLAVEKIKAKAKTVRNKDDIKNIATIASNNDSFIGELVANAHVQIGDDGILTVEDSPKMETYLEFVDGLQLNNGFASPYFINSEKLTCEFKNPYILVTDEEITNVNVIAKILQDIANEGRPLVIIASDFGSQVLPVLIYNKVNNNLQICAVKAPEFGEIRKEILADIATLTGATFISKSLGLDLIHVKIDDLGSAEKIIADKDDTLIIGGNGNKSAIEERINTIKKEIDIEPTGAKKDKMQKRLASLRGGICVLRVYASNDVEMKELKDRIEDTICSVKASVKEGIVLGGGVTLLKIAEELEPPKELTDDQKCGFNIVKKALQAPIRQLAKNSGISSDVIVNKVLKESDGERSGFNFATMEWDDNLFDKVVDPTLVETSALENASSFVGLYFNTEVVITTTVEENNCNCNR